jgi:predicted Zn finger-like uncharacterized protein
MSMITGCPACGTMFKVVPDQLKISDGWVRCGHCAEVFDAAAHMRLLATVRAGCSIPRSAPLTSDLPDADTNADRPDVSRMWLTFPAPVAPPQAPAPVSVPADTLTMPIVVREELAGQLDADRAPLGVLLRDAPSPGFGLSPPIEAGEEPLRAREPCAAEADRHAVDVRGLRDDSPRSIYDPAAGAR